MNKGFTIWLTGPSDSDTEKTVILHLLEKQLKEWGRSVEILDDDSVRINLCQGMGLSRQDTDTGIQRVAFVCKVLAKNGVVVISAARFPYRESRDKARKEIGNCIEVYVKCPSEMHAERDVNGVHKEACTAEIQSPAKVPDPYEEPLNPEIIIETDKEAGEESTHRIIKKLIELRYLDPQESPQSVYSSEEEEKIKERLARLGYL